MSKMPTDDEGSGYVDRSAEWRDKMGLGNVTTMVPPNVELVKALRVLLCLAEKGELSCFYGLGEGVARTVVKIGVGVPEEPFAFLDDVEGLRKYYVEKVIRTKD